MDENGQVYFDSEDGVSAEDRNRYLAELAHSEFKRAEARQQARDRENEEKQNG